MINSAVTISQEKRLSRHSSFNDAMDVDVDVDNCRDQKIPDTENAENNHSHSKTVQALRKYLQRKLSSEDSSSERDRESPQETATPTPVFHRSFDTAEEAKSKSSTLTFSIVQTVAGKSAFPLQKQRSLDDYSMGPMIMGSGVTPSTATATAGPPGIGTGTTVIPDHRYLRTDLCVPILLSRCTFCDQSFELDDQLRQHMREKHWNYFFDRSVSNATDDVYGSSVPSPEVLDLSMRKSTDETGSLPNLSMKNCSLGQNGSQPQFSKKQVRCMTCNKVFSTKWNWKQHQKIHLRENLQAYNQQ